MTVRPKSASPVPPAPTRASLDSCNAFSAQPLPDAPASLLDLALDHPPTARNVAPPESSTTLMLDSAALAVTASTNQRRAALLASSADLERPPGVLRLLLNR